MSKKNKYTTTIYQKTPKIQRIHEEENSSNIGITLWDARTLQEITKNSGDTTLTSGNEYQIHYWALNLRKVFDDKSSLTISIPTVLFNYKQEVTAASVEFDLKDVLETSNMVEILHNVELEKLLPLISTHFKDFERESSFMNSLHKHPGGRNQSFSGTDLNTDHEKDTGIVFPLKKASNMENFAHIICKVAGETFLAHSEFRIANGDIDHEDGITYEQGRTISYVRDSIVTTTPSEAEKLFGIKSTTKDYSYTVEDALTAEEFMESIITIWNNVDYVPNTNPIISDNVTKKSYYTANRNTIGYQPKSTPKTVSPSDAPSAGVVQKLDTPMLLGRPVKSNDMRVNRAMAIRYLKEDDNCFILDKTTILKMTDTELKEHYGALSEHYFGTTFDSFIELPTIKEIDDLQEDIINEWLYMELNINVDNL